MAYFIKHFYTIKKEKLCLVISLFKKVNIYIFIVLLSFLYSCSEFSNSSLLSNLSANFNKGQSNICKKSALFSSLLKKVSFNLVCSEDFNSTYEITVLAFPGESRMGIYPSITLRSNLNTSNIYYTTNGNTPDNRSKLYNDPIELLPTNQARSGSNIGLLNGGSAEDTLNLRFVGSDTNGDLNSSQQENYYYEDGLAEIKLSNLNSHYVSKKLNARNNLTFTFTTNVASNYKIVIEGNSKNTPIETGKSNANQNKNITVPASSFVTGYNRLYIYVTDDATKKEAYTSFVIYLDDDAPFVQATPDQGGYKDRVTVSLKTLEVANIQYRLVNSQNIPNSTPSTLYTSPLQIPPTSVTLPNKYEEDYTLDYIATDLANNSHVRITKKYRIDNTPPVVSNCNGTAPEVSLANGSYRDVGNYYIRPAGRVIANYEVKESLSYIIEVGYNANPENGPLVNQVVYSKKYTTPEDCLQVDILGSYLSQDVQRVQNVTIYFEDLAGNRSYLRYNYYLDNAILTPALSTPFSGFEVANAGGFPVEFSWKTIAEELSGILGYTLEISDSITFTNVASFNVEIVNPAPGTPKNTTGRYVLSQAALNAGLGAGIRGRIYWRVKAIDLVGNISIFSGPRPLLVNYSDASLDFDSIPDTLVGAPGADSNAGKVYILKGSGTCSRALGACNQSGLASWTINNTDNNEVYSIITGSLGDNLGSQVAFVGDINSGGVTDILISAASSNIGTKKVYLVLGETLRTSCPITSASVCELSISSLNPFTFQGIAEDSFGETLSHIGDFNGDGISDFAITASNSPNNPLAFGSFKTGIVYIYYGSTTAYTGSSSPAPSLLLKGESPSEEFGKSLCHIGDVNGDGYSDIFVGSPNGYSLIDRNNKQAPSGVGGIYYGDTISKANASLDVPLYGSEISGSQFGSKCTRAYDVDLDGYEDILVSAPRYSGSIGSNAGKVYLYYGRDKLFTIPAYQFQVGQANGLLGNSILASYLTDSPAAAGAKTSFIFGAPGATISTNAYQFTNTGLSKPARALRTAPNPNDFETFSFSNGDDVITQELTSSLSPSLPAGMKPSLMALWGHGAYVIADSEVNKVFVTRINRTVTPPTFDSVILVGSNNTDKFGSAVSQLP